MKLSEWLDNKGMTQVAFAERLGITASLVSKWTRGTRAPSVRLMKEIHQLTGGRVGLKDWERARREGTTENQDESAG